MPRSGGDDRQSGDCRALQSRKGKIEALTRDHSPTETEEAMRLAQLGLQAEDGYLARAFQCPAPLATSTQTTESNAVG